MYKKDDLLLVNHETKGKFIAKLKEDYNPEDNTYQLIVVEPLDSKVHKTDLEPCSASRCEVNRIDEGEVASIKEDFE